MKQSKYEGGRRAGPRFFFVFCISLCVITLVSVAFIAMIYRPDIVDTVTSGIGSIVSSWGTTSGTSPKVSGQDRRDGVYTVFIGGTDYDGTRTDTMLVATIDTKNDTIDVLSIPRDTRAFMESGAVHKINAAHNKGVERMMIELTNTIGFTPDHYMVMDYGTFKEIIDAIDGVEVDVPMDMYYVADDMVIDLKKGPQILDGEQALMLMRFRTGYANADLGRINTQQLLFKALAGQLMSASTIKNIPELARIFFDDVETNYNLAEVIWLGIQCLGMNAESFSVDRIPGHISGADYVVDPEEALALINEKYNPYKKPITSLNTAK